MIKIKKMDKTKMMIKIKMWAHNYQGGVEQDEDGDDQEESKSSPPPHPRVIETIQRDHPFNNILGDIKKRVTT
jgi:hypothetical protein